MKMKEKVNITVEKIRFYIHRSKNKKLKITHNSSTCIINMKWITCSGLFKTKDSMLLLSFSMVVLLIVWFRFGSVKICLFHSCVMASWKTALPQHRITGYEKFYLHLIILICWKRFLLIANGFSSLKAVLRG